MTRIAAQLKEHSVWDHLSIETALSNPIQGTDVYLRFSVLCQFQEGCDVLTLVVVKIPTFWDITPCSPLKVN
jgi:hypothetical protein